MSSFLNLAQFAPALKQIYPTGVPESLTLKDHPFWAKMKKVQDFYGQNLKLPFRFADPMSVSRTFGTALTNRAVSASQYKNVTLTRGHQYGVIQIDRETILASMNDAGAFLQARKAEIDGVINQVGNRISQDLFGDGSGILGQISSSSNTGTSTVTLSDVNQIVNFEYGQNVVLTASVPSPGTAPSLRTGNGFIIGVDRDAGTLTISATAGGSAANWSTVITSAAAGDYILQAGDNVGYSGTSTTSAIVGLAAWLPLIAPTVGGGDSFFGMDRSADPSRLAGIRYSGTGLPIEEVLNKTAARVARDGGRPDFCVFNYAQLSNLQTSLGAKIRYTEFKSGDARTAVTFAAFSVPGPKGDLTVVADGDCPTAQGYMLQSDCWSFRHLSGAPELVTMGNVNGSLQEATADALQVRVACYGQTMCDAPGYNAVMTLDT